MKNPLFKFKMEQQVLGLVIFATYSMHPLHRVQSLACDILSHKSFTNWLESSFNIVLNGYNIRYYNHQLIFKAILELNKKGVVADMLHIYDYIIETHPESNVFELTNYIVQLGESSLPCNEIQSMLLLFEKSLVDFYIEKLLYLTKNENDIIKLNELSKISNLLYSTDIDILKFADIIPNLLESTGLFDLNEIQEFQSQKKEINNRCKIIADAVNRFNYSLRNVEFRTSASSQTKVLNETENVDSLPPIAPF